MGMLMLMLMLTAAYVDGQVQLGPRDPGLRAGVLEHREHQGPLNVNVDLHVGSERRRRHLVARAVHRLGGREGRVVYYIVPVPRFGSGHCCAAQWVDVLLYTKMLIMTVPPCAPGTARHVPGRPRRGMRQNECPSFWMEKMSEL